MSNEKNESVDQQIEEMISSEDSVVGIDAKKTHIIIIRKLMDIENRLQAIEKKLDESE